MSKVTHYKHEIKNTSNLIPYVNNSRTHSDEQINQTISKSMLKNGCKSAICEDCGKESIVRKDTNPKVCKICASSRGGKALKGSIRAERKKCKGCEKQIRKSLKQDYCSRLCSSSDKREERECKKCKKSFIILKSALNTNASGSFCSRSCYEEFLCKTNRTTGRGSQWKKIRDEVISSFPFCAVCGTSKNLQVHHIIPFRLTFDNSKQNLIPLCTAHHKKIEYSFISTENEINNIDTQSLVWRNILRSRQLSTLTILRSIHNAN